jgi:hypothetical protein
MSVTLGPQNVFDENEEGSEAGHSNQDFGEGAMDETHVAFHHFSTVRPKLDQLLTVLEPADQHLASASARPPF